MARAISCFSPDHTAGILHWSGYGKPNDFPIGPINHLLERLYEDVDLSPYLYCVYDDNENEIGMLVAGNFNPDNAMEIKAIFDQIHAAHQAAPQSDHWGPNEWEV